VAQLYAFPLSNGAGQTIGIYEMQTEEGSAGYTAQELALTMEAFGGGLTVPTPVDVAVDAIGNSGVSDGETVLDITVSSSTLEVGIFKHSGPPILAEFSKFLGRLGTFWIDLIASRARRAPQFDQRRPSSGARGAPGRRIQAGSIRAGRTVN
jgi:hypothetical protein